MAGAIFIVGTPRSGTTWLANTLGGHSRVACVYEGRLGERGGVNESAFFSYVSGKFGNLKNDNNLIQLIETFGGSTFFILSGVDKSVFYKKKPQTYQDFFRVFMDELAEKQHADLWLEKTPSHTFHLNEISRYYGDAKFVIIRRNVLDQIRSFIKMNEVISGVKTAELGFLRKKVEILVRLFKYYAHTKHLSHFSAKNPDKTWQIDYEDFAKRAEQVIRELCGFLNIDFEEIMLEGYIRNTSFESEDDREAVLSAAEVKGIHILGRLMRLLPYRLYRLVYLTKRVLEGRKFPYWFFSYNIEKYGWANVFGKGHERIKYNPED